jgi:hypothetical protein
MLSFPRQYIRNKNTVWKMFQMRESDQGKLYNVSLIALRQISYCIQFVFLNQCPWLLDTEVISLFLNSSERSFDLRECCAQRRENNPSFLSQSWRHYFNSIPIHNEIPLLVSHPSIEYLLTLSGKTVENYTEYTALHF